jgi:hypothetical protein
MAPSSNNPDQFDDARALWLAIAFVLVLAVAANVGVWLTAGDDEGPVPPAQVATVRHNQVADRPGVTGPAPVAQCRRLWDAQGRPLQSAEESLGQWRLHITAMNRLVAGRITLDQATAYWNRTRVGAKARIDRFRDSYGRYQAMSADCRPAPGGTADARSPAAVRRCAKAVRASDRALERADTAIGTWEHHVHDMEMLRAGKLSPDEATRMWLANWRKGQQQVRQYGIAARQALRLQCP